MRYYSSEQESEPISSETTTVEQFKFHSSPKKQTAELLFDEVKTAQGDGDLSIVYAGSSIKFEAAFAFSIVIGAIRWLSRATRGSCNNFVRGR